jgi:DNA recombination protein RmuC
VEGFLIILGLVAVAALVLVVVPALVAARVTTGRDERGMGVAGVAGDPAERDRVLHAAIEHLVQVNHEVMAGERELGARDLDGTKALIDQELAGMRSDLHRLGSLVQQVERERRQHVGELGEQLAATGRTTQLLADTTQSLREALSSTSARGQWGERMADDVLQLAGFVDGVNYHRQRAMPSGGVPDYTFVLPRGLCVHMDVKFPFDNYLRHLDAVNDAERERLCRAFLKDVRLRLREVTSRGYIDPVANTIDCVLLFIPNEQVYGFIHEHDRSLLDDALRHKVVLCSPLTLFAVLSVIRQSVDNFRLSQTSQEVLTLLQRFDKQWGKFVDQMDKVGRSLDTATHAFAELEGTRRRQLERELDRIEALRRDQQLEGVEGAELKSDASPDTGDDLTLGVLALGG